MNKNITQEIKIEFQKAINLHQKREFEKAKSSYERVLEINPKDFDSTHMLGVLHVQTGNLILGLELIDKAIAINPKIAITYCNKAEALFQNQQIQAAIQLYKKAIKVDPKYFDAYFKLGSIYNKFAEYKNAIEIFNQAIEYFPRNFILYHAKADALFALSYDHEAIEFYSKAIEINPKFALSYNNRAIVYKKRSRFDKAFMDYKKSILLDPNNDEFQYNLGNLQKDSNNFDDALASYKKAITLNPNFADAYNNIGNIYLRLSRYGEALTNCEIAISLKPDLVEAFINRGQALKELNRLDEALTSYEKAVELNPHYSIAYLELARFQSELGKFSQAEINYKEAYTCNPKMIAPLYGIAQIKKFDQPDSIFGEIKQRLSDKELSNDDRSSLHHAYAKICNDLGQYDEAFKNFSLGKSVMQSAFNIEMLSAKYSAMIELFTIDFFTQRQGFGLSDQRPVFIVGMPRSGTSLAEQILATHHQIDGLGELADIPNVTSKYMKETNNLNKFCEIISSLKIDVINSMAEKYSETFDKSKEDCIRLIDKNPLNFESLGFIALMFPNAHIIHCRRNALDNCVSIFTQKFSESHGYNQDLYTLGRFYREYERLMNHWANTLPLKIYDFCYEENIDNFETSARSVISFLGLDWDPECLNYNEKNRKVSTPSLWQVRQPLYKKSVERWKFYEKHLVPLKQGLGIE